MIQDVTCVIDYYFLVTVQRNPYYFNTPMNNMFHHTSVYFENIFITILIIIAISCHYCFQSLFPCKRWITSFLVFFFVSISSIILMLSQYTLPQSPFCLAFVPLLYATFYIMFVIILFPCTLRHCLQSRL